MNHINLLAAVDNIIELNERLTAVTEQRDALAKALEQLIKYQPRSTVVTMNAHHVWRNARETLRSITPTQTEQK